MTSLASHAKRLIGPLLARRWRGLVAALQAIGRVELLDRLGSVVVLQHKAA